MEHYNQMIIDGTASASSDYVPSREFDDTIPKTPVSQPEDGDDDDGQSSTPLQINVIPPSPVTPPESQSLSLTSSSHPTIGAKYYGGSRPVIGGKSPISGIIVKKNTPNTYKEIMKTIPEEEDSDSESESDDSSSSTSSSSESEAEEEEEEMKSFPAPNVAAAVDHCHKHRVYDADCYSCQMVVINSGSKDEDDEKKKNKGSNKIHLEDSDSDFDDMPAMIPAAQVINKKKKITKKYCRTPGCLTKSDGHFIQNCPSSVCTVCTAKLRSENEEAAKTLESVYGHLKTSWQCPAKKQKATGMRHKCGWCSMTIGHIKGSKCLWFANGFIQKPRTYAEPTKSDYDNTDDLVQPQVIKKKLGGKEKKIKRIDAEIKRVEKKIQMKKDGSELKKLQMENQRLHSEINKVANQRDDLQNQLERVEERLTEAERQMRLMRRSVIRSEDINAKTNERFLEFMDWSKKKEEALNKKIDEFTDEEKNTKKVESMIEKFWLATKAFKDSDQPKRAIPMEDDPVEKRFNHKRIRREEEDEDVEEEKEEQQQAKSSRIPKKSKKTTLNRELASLVA